MKNLKLYSCFDHWKEFNNIWVISDPHFNDDEMKYLRKEYIGDDEQVKRINSKVGKKDLLICLGDVGDVSFVKKLKGYKVLIKGNHDAGTENYKRVKREEEVAVDDYSNKSANELSAEASELFPNSETSQEEWIDEQYNIFRKKALEEYKKKEDFITLSDSVIYTHYSPFILWEAEFDNRLFDEVYEGPLFINEKLLLSHEPIDYPYALNIHGHDHSNWYKGENKVNVCTEMINYTPKGLAEILKDNPLGRIKDIHRDCVDKAINRKFNKGEK